MKTRALYLYLCLMCCLLAVNELTGQGNLVPSSTPGPVMKSLDQLQARTPISAATTPGDADSLFKITQPGSYYLTGNVTGVASKYGIEIAAHGVSLDLMGFSLTGVPGSFEGIKVTLAGATNVLVRNGMVRAWGLDGVDVFSAGTAAQLCDLISSGNGGAGFAASAGTTVTRCIARGNGTQGILGGGSSVVTDCIASGNGTAGIQVQAGSVVEGCSVHDNTGAGIEAGAACTIRACIAGNNSGNGIRVFGDGTVTESIAYSNSGDGFNVGSGSSVRHCNARSNGGDGIELRSDARILNNNCCNNGTTAGAGIYAATTAADKSRIDGNHLAFNDTGLQVEGDRNLIIHNSAAGNPTPFSITGTSNVVGPTITSSNIDTSSNPHANYEH